MTDATAPLSDRRPNDQRGRLIVTAIALFFFAVWTLTSYARWANFSYRTFDLAYYVQAIWQLIHGRFQVSVENVPLLGNHVEPIVFLFAPLFFVFRHPMLFVVVQNIGLAALGPIGYNIARRLGFADKQACLLGVALLVTPATGYIALHEFHPEALAAPFLLLMLQARVARSILRHWLWFLAALACKENMALLLAAYCAVLIMVERKRPPAELRQWFAWPLLVAVLWFALCSFVITPAFNSGNIDYLTLYNRLGSSPGEIVRHAFTEPQLFLLTLFRALHQGNLFWALLLPFLALPLLRPRWLIIASPILLQHFLSWRSSEWMIYFHYAAPLLPLFWMAAVEALRPAKSLAADTSAAPKRFRERASPYLRFAPWLMVGACAVAQVWLGPVQTIASDLADYSAGRLDRARKNASLAQIPAEASVVAPLPYLSHLALRERLYSLHYILKGLRTLSHAAYEPPAPADFVLIDYSDSATFDAGAGYYHPVMQTQDERLIPSSDRLLSDFLKGASWFVDSRDALTLFRRMGGPRSDEEGDLNPESKAIFTIGTHTQLVSIRKSETALSPEHPIEIDLRWKFKGEREIFPWMVLRLSRGEARPVLLTKGLCAPEAAAGDYDEVWHVTFTPEIPPGDYKVEAIFFDHAKRAWYEATGGGEARLTLLAPPVSLGTLRINSTE